MGKSRIERYKAKRAPRQFVPLEPFRTFTDSKFDAYLSNPVVKCRCGKYVQRGRPCSACQFIPKGEKT